MDNTEKKRKTPNKPVRYSPEVDREICTRIARNEALVEICRDKHMPSDTAVNSWLSKGAQRDKKYVEFLARYLRAREASAERVDAEIRDISRRMLLPKVIDNPAYDVARAADDKAYSVIATIPNPDFVDAQAGREVISAHKWRAAHLNAGRYGNRVEVAHSGTVKHDHAHKVDPPDWIKAEIEQDDAPPMIEVEAQEVETKH